MAYRLKINGKIHSVDAPAEMPLLWVLRDLLDYKGAKYGCGVAQCGACTVHLAGQPAPSCSVPLDAVGDAEITTIEGVGKTQLGRKVQAAWIALDVPQCGYCQAGQIMSACALLAANPKPSDADIDGAMARNLCRCCTYPRIRKAIKAAAGLEAGKVG